MVAASHLLLLPNELLVNVLSYVDYRQLTTLELTCRSLRAVILGSVILQYKLELAAAGMRDGTNNQFSSSERLELLQKHQAAWKQLTWQARSQLPSIIPSGVMTLSVSGNLFAYCIHGSEHQTDTIISVAQTPSVLRGLEYRRWEIKLDFGIARFDMDASQDLLLVGTTEREPHQACIHMLTISTGEPHPSAANAGLIVLRELHLLGSPNVEICGDFIGCPVGPALAMSENGKKKIMIWNWKTGMLVAESMLPQAQANHLGGFPPFTFLDSSHIVVIDTRSRRGYAGLQVYRFRAPSWSGHHQDMVLCCELGLPEIDPNARFPMTFWFQDNSSPHVSSDPQISAPFSTDPSERLLAIAVDGQTPYNIVIPSRTILSYLDAPKNPQTSPWIPPSTWTQYAHFRSQTVDEGAIGRTSVFGTKTFQIWVPTEPGDMRPARMVVTDYHPKRVARACRGDAKMRISEPAADSSFFTTKIPYLIHEAELPEDLQANPHRVSNWVLPCEDSLVTFRPTSLATGPVTVEVHMLTF